MAEPNAWLLLQALQARLRQITTANGYRTDIGIGPVVIDEDDVPAGNVPAVIVRLGAFEPTATVTATEVSESVPVTVQYSVPRTGNNDATLLALRARVDLLRCLQFKEKETLPLGSGGWRITGSAIGDAEEQSGQIYAIAEVTARVTLREAFTRAPNPTPGP